MIRDHLETRKTYRAVFSEPVLILPPDTENPLSEEQVQRERPVQLTNLMSSDISDIPPALNAGEAVQVNPKKRVMNDEASEATDAFGGVGKVWSETRLNSRDAMKRMSVATFSGASIRARRTTSK